MRTCRPTLIRTMQAASGLCIALMAFSGCERNVVRTDYFPLRDGNCWEYRLLDHPRLKALAAGQAVTTEPSISTQPMDPEETAQPKALMVNPDELGSAPASLAPARRVSMELKEGVDLLTFRATYDGFQQVWSKRGGYVGFQNQRGRHYLLILPPHSGYRWVVTDEDSGENLYYEIEGQSSVETPGGTFKDCAVTREETRNKQEVVRYWFAPDVGLVRRSKYVTDEEVFRQELVRYTVRPARQDVRDAEDAEVQAALRGKNRGSEHRRRTEPAP